MKPLRNRTDAHGQRASPRLQVVYDMGCNNNCWRRRKNTVTSQRKYKITVWYKTTYRESDVTDDDVIDARAWEITVACWLVIECTDHSDAAFHPVVLLPVRGDLNGDDVIGRMSGCRQRSGPGQCLVDRAEVESVLGRRPAGSCERVTVRNVFFVMIFLN